MRLLPVAALFLAAVPLDGQTLRLEAEAFGLPVVIETFSGDGAREAITAAWDEIKDLQRYLHPERGIVSGLNEAAGDGPRRIDHRVAVLLARAAWYCRWSQGTHGPLGGPLYELWGLRQPDPRLPQGEPLRQAVARAGCDGIDVDPENNTVVLATDRKLELWGFVRGFVVDRAAVVLFEHGIDNATVTMGNIQRASGSGPEGRGWPAALPVDESTGLITEGLFLRDRSLAIVSAADGALEAGAATFPPYLDQRTGRPPSGVYAVGAVTDLALDAQAVAVTAFAAGNRRGSHYAGRLDPLPAIRWLLGEGASVPLITDFRWSAARAPR